MYRVPARLLAVPALALGLAACGQDVTRPSAAQLLPGGSTASSTSSDVNASGTTSVLATYTVNVNQSVSIKTRTTTRANRLNWSSSNPAVASVTRQGVVTGLSLGSATIVASSSGVRESYAVNVTAPTVTAFSLSPETGATLEPGQTRQFTTSATWSDLQARAATVTYTATGGTINSNGLFTAGSLAGAFLVVANCTCGISDTAFVNVAAAQAQLVSLTIAPKTVSLAPGASQQFSTTAQWSTGSTTLPPITYSSTGGTISTSGAYVAPATAGTYRVIVAHSGGSVRDTATVTVTGGNTSTGGGTIPSTFGPGPNAPAWSNKTIYPQELFNTPIPVHYSGPNAAGFKGWQGFDGVWGIVYKPTRVTYPIVNTPLGTKPVLQVTFPGTSTSINASNNTSAIWPTEQAWGVRVTGTWVGTLVFERTLDGTNWTPVTLTGAVSAGETAPPNGSQTTRNGVWVSGDALGADGGKFRVRAANWTSGTAIVAVGMEGGGAAARMNAGDFVGNPTRVYTRVLMYVDPNWSNGNNTGTKFFFFSNSQGNGHYTGVIGGLESEGASGTFVGLQGNGLNRNMSGSASVANGRWLDVEFLFVANSPGSSNGVVRAWVNGVESQHNTDVMFFASGSVPGFASFFMDPTYGGGFAPPPRNVYFQIAGWYRESAP